MEDLSSWKILAHKRSNLMEDLHLWKSVTWTIELLSTIHTDMGSGSVSVVLERNVIPWLGTDVPFCSCLSDREEYKSSLFAPAAAGFVHRSNSHILVWEFLLWDLSLFPILPCGRSLNCDINRLWCKSVMSHEMLVSTSIITHVSWWSSYGNGFKVC